MNAEHIADQVLPTGAAFAGLLLVFLSNAVSGFGSTGYSLRWASGVPLTLGIVIAF